MRPLNDLRLNLEEFVEQHDYSMLALGCDDRDVPLILKTVDALDQEDRADLVFSLSMPFDSPASWVHHVSAWFSAQRDVYDARRGDAAPLPPAPARAVDPCEHPHERLHAWLEHLHALLPDATEHHALACLMPVEVRDPDGYARLMALLTPDTPRPWMSSVRLLVRDRRHDGPLAATVRARGVPGVLVSEVDFSVEAVTASLEETAGDVARSERERMAAEMQLAMIDYSHQRHGDAMRRYGRLHAWHGAQRQPAMQALCQLGVGDSLRASGDTGRALQRYQAGVAQAVAAESHPVLLNLLLAAGGCCVERAQHADALAYYECAARAASLALNPPARADATVRQGDALLALGRPGDAMVRWREAVDAARTFHCWEPLEEALERQHALLRQARDTARAAAVESDLAAVRDPARREAWADARGAS